MNLLRFDTVAYRPPARVMERFPVLQGQIRCSTGVTLRVPIAAQPAPDMAPPGGMDVAAVRVAGTR